MLYGPLPLRSRIPDFHHVKTVTLLRSPRPLHSLDTWTLPAGLLTVLAKCIVNTNNSLGRGWCIGRVDAFHPKGHGFDSRSSYHVGTLGKSFTHSCRWCFGVKLRHSIRAVSRAPLSRSGLEEVL